LARAGCGDRLPPDALQCRRRFTPWRAVAIGRAVVGCAISLVVALLDRPGIWTPFAVSAVLHVVLWAVAIRELTQANGFAARELGLSPQAGRRLDLRNPVAFDASLRKPRDANPRSTSTTR
jgi:hypothetical protein